ncbi:MAG: hypothetical protein IPF99_20080 [Deltaproteobacteria bacterium]|nr:hypothetical protein [Deltaproteobacteria bacterium]
MVTLDGGGIALPNPTVVAYDAAAWGDAGAAANAAMAAANAAMAAAADASAQAGQALQNAQNALGDAGVNTAAASSWRGGGRRGRGDGGPPGCGPDGPGGCRSGGACRCRSRRRARADRAPPVASARRLLPPAPRPAAPANGPDLPEHPRLAEPPALTVPSPAA